MHRLLETIRVIDMTTVVLGPFATQFLADLGAEVIKVEPPGGDVFRAVRPGRSPAMGAGFLNCNRNKRSVCIDLKRPEGREALLAISRTADVFVHNMRAASAVKLGIAHADLSGVNPGILYCGAPGFGRDGPYADDPAYDDTIQAASGLAFMNSDAKGEPRFLPTIIGDKVGGMHLALAVLAGLVNRQRTGKGCEIEVPMFESIVAFLMAEQLGGRTFVPPLGPMGYERLQSPHRRPFRTRDGHVSILPYTSQHWGRFLRLIGQAALADAPWVNDPVLRSQNVGTLYKLVAEATPARTSAEWLRQLRAIDVPCAPVNRIDDLPDDPHLRQVGLFQPIRHADEGALLSCRDPFTVIGGTPRADRPAPRLGQDTIPVLRAAGLDDDKIQQMIRAGVVTDAGHMREDEHGDD